MSQEGEGYLKQRRKREARLRTSEKKNEAEEEGEIKEEVLVNTEEGGRGTRGDT